MAVDPIDGIGPRGGAAPTGYVAPGYANTNYRATTTDQATGAQEGPGADQLFATKQGLDQREEAYRGIVGGDQQPAQGAKTGGENNFGALSDKTGDQVTDAELQRLFGSEANSAREILKARPQLRVGDIIPMRKDQDGLSAVSKLLSSRSDLNLDDVVDRTPGGEVKVNPTLRDSQSLDLMVNHRKDVKPGELSSMAGSFAKILDNPAMAKQAYQGSLELMKQRGDVRPQQLATMMGSIAHGVDPKSQKGPENSSAVLEMFNKSLDVMKVRNDVAPEDMGRLAEKAGQTFGNEKDPNSTSNVKNGFNTAADMLAGNPGRSVTDTMDLMDTVNNRFPGQDNGADKAAAFNTAATLMGKFPQLDARGIDGMLQKKAEGPPPLQGDKLLNAFNSQAEDLTSGRANLDSAVSQRSQQTDRQVREEKVADKENRITEGRLADPQELKDTEEGRNDPQGQRPDAGQKPDQGARPGQANAPTGEVNPRENALDLATTDPANPAAGGPKPAQ
ncbi:MAG: hypothetical protein FJX76_04975 [Armatimonadetes bacterium]|nr:hypothetical protein [Armatimonadota bacterium]